jgi:dihydrofolate reductase
MATNRVIGINNQLPWKLPADMKWFRKHTLGKTIIMGRKTFESFGGKSLPDRKNIIITQDNHYHTDQAEVCHSIEEAIKVSKSDGVATGVTEEAIIIGGMSLYKQTLPTAYKLFMTVVFADVDGDAWFPVFYLNDWVELENHSHETDEKNAYRCNFKILQRKTA